MGNCFSRPAPPPNFDDGVCAICCYPHTNKSRLECGHIFCFQCLIDWCVLKMRCPTCNKTFKSFDHETIDSPSTGKYNKTYTPFSRDEIFGKCHRLTQNEQIELFNQMMSIYEMTLVIQEKREKRLMRFSKNPIQTVVNNLKESFEMWKLQRKINRFQRKMVHVKIAQLPDNICETLKSLRITLRQFGFILPNW